MKSNSSAMPSLVRKLNIRRVVDVLRDNLPLSRAEITRLTGISSPTMTKLIEQLLKSRVIEEYERPPAGGRGRPSKGYALGVARNSVLCVTVETDKVTIFSTVPTRHYQKFDLLEFPAPQCYEELVGCIKGYIGARVVRGGRFVCAALQLGCVADRDSKNILYCESFRFLEGKSPIAEALRAFNETSMVKNFIVSNEEALCIAEKAHQNVGEGMDFAVVDIEQHLQFGVVSNGKLVRGISGYGGSLGHLVAHPSGGELCSCGRHGCFETLGAEKYFLNRLARKLDLESLNMDEVQKLGEDGKINISQEAHELILTVSYAVGAVMNLFNPSHIVIKSRLATMIPDFIEQIRWYSSKRVMFGAYADCEIKLAKTDKEFGVIYKMSNHLLAAVGGV